MENSIDTFRLIQIFIAMVFTTLYTFAFIVVKPFLINHKRPTSTLLLKLTYIIYLGILLLCVFLFMFYAPSEAEHNLSEAVFFPLLVICFIPNLGILFRRYFEKYRNVFNYVFATINSIVIIGLIFKLDQLNWFIF